MHSQILVHRWAPRTVTDPDLQIRRGPDHPVPEMGEGAVSAGARSPSPPLDPPLQNKVFGTVLWTD